MGLRATRKQGSGEDYIRRWARHVARMGNRKLAYRVLVGET